MNSSPLCTRPLKAKLTRLDARNRAMRAAARAAWKAAGGDEEAGVPGRGARKKWGFGLRAWLAVDGAGEARAVEEGKHTIMRRTGLPARDLRILDPQLSYPSTVLGRERAIVINLEHIKAIVTAHEVLLLNARDPAVVPFVHELQRRLHLHHRQQSLTDALEVKNPGNEDWTDVYNTEEPQSRTRTPHLSSGDPNYSTAFQTNLELEEKGEGEMESTVPNSNGPRALPFEFIALEACLEATCSCLENEATTLEQEAHPALDKLTSKISTLNLEHVRQIKSRLVAITGRVQKVRDELEHLLDDDDDMAEMYLTDKLMRQQLSNGSPSHSSLNERDDSMADVGTRAEISSDENNAEISSDENNVPNNFEEDSQNIENQGSLLSGFNVIIGDGRGTHTCSTRSGSKHLDVEELEMLLEAYFVQIDSTLNKLSTLREYVDDTEDYINIMLDDKQNHLLQMGVMLTTATLIVSAFVVLAGIFGMNIQNDLFDEKKSGTTEFLWTVGGGAAGSLFLYVVAMAWCKHKRLLE